MTYELLLLSGIPGSGKSTWAEATANEIEDRHETVAIVSRDKIRYSMLKDGEDYFSHEDEVFNEYVRQINEAMELGINYVIADATHLTENSINKLLSCLLPDPKTCLEVVLFDCPLDFALTRNAQRKGFARVPDEQVIKMKKKFNPYALTVNPHEFRTVYYKVLKVETNLFKEVI